MRSLTIYSCMINNWNIKYSTVFREEATSFWAQFHGSFILVKLQFWMLVFLEGGKPDNPGKNCRRKARTNSKLNLHMALGWNRSQVTFNLLVTTPAPLHIPAVIANSLSYGDLSLDESFSCRCNISKIFSNSLIIHQAKTKEITSVKEVWIPDHN